MLKKISPLLSPELLKVLCEMGHGDEIILADANFPALTCGAKHVLRADGVGANALLDAVLDLFPVDGFVAQPVALMQVVPGDPYVPEIWDDYKATLKKYGIAGERIETVERFAFYERAQQAYCIVATGERARYANILLKKGVLEPNE